MTTREPGLRVVLTQGLLRSPARTALRASSPAPTMTAGHLLFAIATTGYNERIYVRGDTNADYGTVMKVMARISAAGFKNLGLVTLQEQEK